VQVDAAATPSPALTPDRRVEVIEAAGLAAVVGVAVAGTGGRPDACLGVAAALAVGLLMHRLDRRAGGAGVLVAIGGLTLAGGPAADVAAASVAMAAGLLAQVALRPGGSIVAGGLAGALAGVAATVRPAHAMLLAAVGVALLVARSRGPARDADRQARATATLLAATAVVLLVGRAVEWMLGGYGRVGLPPAVDPRASAVGFALLAWPALVAALAGPVPGVTGIEVCERLDRGVGRKHWWRVVSGGGDDEASRLGRRSALAWAGLVGALAVVAPGEVPAVAVAPAVALLVSGASARWVGLAGVVPMLVWALWR